MSDTQARVAEVRKNISEARKTVRKIAEAHQRLKSRPAVRFILMLNEKKQGSGGPPTSLSLGAGLLHIAVEDLRGATTDLLQIYEANERLFGSGTLEELLDEIDVTLRSLERDLQEGKPRPDAVSLLNVASAVANAVLAAYNTFR